MLRKCTKCGELKQHSEFSTRSASHDGLNYWCKQCNRDRNKKWRKDNTERKAAYEKFYREENIEKVKARQSAYYSNNKAGYVSRSRARRHRVTVQGLNLPREKEAIDGLYKESTRKTLETGVLSHVDHIVPLKHSEVCGLHASWNLQILTATENDAKGNKFDPALGLVDGILPRDLPRISM